MPVLFKKYIKMQIGYNTVCTAASRPFPKYCTNSLSADILPRHMMVFNSVFTVLDSDSMIPDPDPAFRLNTDPGSGF
jgi:hypothetical protein